MLSAWEKSSFYHPTDIAVIGAGLTGLITSIYLKRKSPTTTVRLIERTPYPSGASAKNAGFACYGSVSEILDDINSESESKALERVLMRYEGLAMLREIAGDNDIGWMPDNGYEVFTEDESELSKKCIEGLPLLNDSLRPEFGFDPFTITGNEHGTKFLEKVIKIEGEASLNSGKLLNILIARAREAGVIMNFGTQVLGMEWDEPHWELHTIGNPFKAGKIIFATNAFTRKFLDVPIFAHRGQVMLTSLIKNLRLKGNYHLNRGYFYFRPFYGGVMIGGGRHLDRTKEQTFEEGISEKIQTELESLLRNRIVPGEDFHIVQRWSGIMAFGPDNEKEPLIQEIKPGIFVGARLGGMGVAMAPQVARELTKQILG